MAFSLTEWATQVKARLQAWAQTPHAWRDAGAQTLFGFLATMALLPLVEALGKGSAMGVGMALGSIAAGASDGQEGTKEAMLPGSFHLSFFNL